MVLRNSIAKTKRFFHRTIGSLKSLLSGGYERLPKTSPFNSCSRTAAGGGGVDINSHQSFQELDNFYRDFINRWDSSDLDKAKKRNKKKQQLIDNEEIDGGSFLEFGNQLQAKIRHEDERRTETEKETRRSHGGGGDIGSNSHSDSNRRESRGQSVVVQKLKELEMMDSSDMEHVLDIEEVLHYYSRLTCPTYLDMVNKCFIDMYSGFFIPQPSSVSSTPAGTESDGIPH
ncbi:hypothetical protein NE237_025967 [Protea cynaroides]|uniref:OVATE domain-containing protein n=1 Tax=Protea cynaroides TaxID=273540 RepID=A0A9Q0H582_9MAGN|nr:hypothetical protein NE237_025967 [Protea cynaroides]